MDTNSTQQNQAVAGQDPVVSQQQQGLGGSSSAMPTPPSPAPLPQSQAVQPTSSPQLGPQESEVVGEGVNNAEDKSSEPVIASTENTGSEVAPTTGEYPYSMDYLLDLIFEKDASDIHFTAGYPTMLRIDGSLEPVGKELLTKDDTFRLVNSILTEDKKELLDINREVDCAYAHGEKCRFRVNAFYQRQTVSAALRKIPDKIKTIEDLGLPEIFYQFTKIGQGLVLVTGPTGSGKTTTLAAMLQDINLTRPVHVITIEDPVEYVYPTGLKAMFDQREMHDDTHSWEVALKSAMRQDPDVVLVGEMRDYETIAAAVTLAETGHLVFATLHTNNAAQTVDRIIDVFPEGQQEQIRAQLGNILEGVIAQRLIPLDGGGRRAVHEIMVATNAVRNLIREGKTHQLDNIIMTGGDIGMMSMESSLAKLVRESVITVEKAQHYAPRPEEITRLVK